MVVDEFTGWIDNESLKRICDRYPYMVQTKGGAVPFVAKRVIITSNLPPEMWYKRGLRAMKRRLEEPIGYVFFVGVDGQSEDDYKETLEPRGDSAFAPGFRR